MDKDKPEGADGVVRATVDPPRCSRDGCRFRGVPGQFVRRPTAGGWGIACWCGAGHYIMGRGVWYSKAETLTPGHVVEELRWLKLEGDRDETCQRCGSSGRTMEEHHWAPRSRFDDADAWPTSLLCAACHQRWHRVMDGGR